MVSPALRRRFQYDCKSAHFSVFRFRDKLSPTPCFLPGAGQAEERKEKKCKKVKSDRETNWTKEYSLQN